MTEQLKIDPADEHRLEKLSRELVEISAKPRSRDQWPNQQLQLCSKYGVFKWFISEQHGGFGRSQPQILEGYIKLASACLTTTFVITQRAGACKRIASSENVDLARRLLPDLASGELSATLGISHLTTSSRHLDKPILSASETESGWLLEGLSPWVTGAKAADHLVIGSEVESGGQILLAVPANLPGIEIGSPNELIALSGSMTGQVIFNRVLVPHDYVLSGPAENILQRGSNQSTGGLQTSALAIGLALSAINFLVQEAAKPNRSELLPKADALNQQYQNLVDRIIRMAGGQPVSTSEELRTDANSFVLRATQAALVAAKGAGFVAGHPVGRWCQEALFFLVWSCPQVVRDANLCELVGIAD